MKKVTFFLMAAVFSMGLMTAQQPISLVEVANEKKSAQTEERTSDVSVRMAQPENIQQVKPEFRRQNPFVEALEASGIRMSQHPSIPYVYIAEPVEEEPIINKREAKAEGCDATLTYVGHDNEWATIPEGFCPKLFSSTQTLLIAEQ